MKLIAIDFETHLISNEAPIPKPVCLSYYGAEQKGIVTGSDGMEAFLFNILNSDHIILAHNAAFELQVIVTYFPKLEKLVKSHLNKGTFICTKVYEQLLNNVRDKQIHSFALDALVKNYFKEDISEDKKNPNSWRLRYQELEDVALEEWPKEAYDYALNDSKWTYKLYLEQKKTPVEYKLSVEADYYLNRMGSRGFYIDQSRVQVLESELQEILKPKYAVLEKEELIRRENGKVKKKMKVFREYIVNNVEGYEKTAKGTVATSSEALTRYLGKLDPESKIYEVINNYLEIMKYEKILTAFVSRLKEANPVLRSGYTATVSSGRTSSSSSKLYPSVNIQQMPRSVDNVSYSIRNCFKPRRMYTIVSIDYAGLELASTAHSLYKSTGRYNMLKAVNSGDVPTDMHSMLAYRIMNLKEKTSETYESFVERKKEPKYAAYRQLSKPINLGFPGGIGYDTMRTLLARDNIYPKLEVLKEGYDEKALLRQACLLKADDLPVRVRRVSPVKYELVYDELVELKTELLNMYPDLGRFLKEEHKNYLNGKSKKMKNEFGEWEDEPLYDFDIPGFSRRNCMYTQVCNGFLMQSPAAIGAKRAVCAIMRQYENSEVVNPLAFIHDEIVFEVKECPEMYAIIKDISEIMIDEMQSVLTTVRICVEAEAFKYWDKSGGFYEAKYWKNAGDSQIRSNEDKVSNEHIYIR